MTGKNNTVKLIKSGVLALVTGLVVYAILKFSNIFPCSCNGFAGHIQYYTPSTAKFNIITALFFGLLIFAICVPIKNKFVWLAAFLLLCAWAFYTKYQIYITCGSLIIC